jgi:hypothetical protein
MEGVAALILVGRRPWRIAPSSATLARPVRALLLSPTTRPRMCGTVSGIGDIVGEPGSYRAI